MHGIEERPHRPLICAGVCDAVSGECPWLSVCDPKEMTIVKLNRGTNELEIME